MLDFDFDFDSVFILTENVGRCKHQNLWDWWPRSFHSLPQRIQIQGSTSTFISFFCFVFGYVCFFLFVFTGWIVHVAKEIVQDRNMRSCKLHQGTPIHFFQFSLVCLFFFSLISFLFLLDKQVTPSGWAVPIRFEVPRKDYSG